MIDVVERAYDAERDEHQWLSHICDATRPLLDQGLGVVAYTYRNTNSEIRLGTFVTSRTPPGLVEGLQQISAVVPPEYIESRTARPLIVGSVTESLPTQRVKRMYEAAMAEHLGVVGMADQLTISARHPNGFGIEIGVPLRQARRSTSSERRMWSRVAAHLGAAFRLRHLPEVGCQGEHGTVEAILTTTGALSHAEPAARSRGAMAALGAATRALDRARSQLRRADPIEALELWQTLVAGRWSLVDQFDSDGKHLIVARRNDPSVSIRVLTERERQVAAYVALGHSNKLIAYELGINVATVAALLRRALRKLGLASRVDLIAAVAAGAAD